MGASFFSAAFLALAALEASAFLVSCETLYEALTCTKTPVETPRARAAFMRCFLISVCNKTQGIPQQLYMRRDKEGYKNETCGILKDKDLTTLVVGNCVELYTATWPRHNSPTGPPMNMTLVSFNNSVDKVIASKVSMS